MTYQACVCCERRIVGEPTRASSGPMHFDCWNEWHSDPSGTPGHAHSSPTATTSDEPAPSLVDAKGQEPA